MYATLSDSVIRDGDINSRLCYMFMLNHH